MPARAGLHGGMSSTAAARRPQARSGTLRGIVALPARLEPWQLGALRARPTASTRWLDEHGSPLNLLDPAPMARNAAELRDAARGYGVELGIFFARKANKALAFVDEARRLGLGVDVASERELARCSSAASRAARWS